MAYKCILGDCLEEMRKIPTHSIDVVFTSPPYNDSGKTEADKAKRRHFKYENAESRDDWFEWQCECIDEMLRICKRQVLYNVQPILSNKRDVYKIIGHYEDKIDQILIWYKPNSQPQHYPHRIANFYEMVLILKGKDFDKLYINSNGYTNVIVKNINSNHTWSSKHRALMSESFCDEIIKEFTQDGDTVLDPFMGLATTGLSCRKYNRDFVGIEIHQPYYEIAQQRLADAHAQMTLFDLGRL
jgi:DNA modification methylase